MGLFKIIGAAVIILFLLAAMRIWFPEETGVLLNGIYSCGLILLKLLWKIIVKLAGILRDWLIAHK